MQQKFRPLFLRELALAGRFSHGQSNMKKAYPENFSKFVEFDGFKIL